MLFKDRTEAGRALGEALQEYARRRDVLVLAIPRGGVPVAVEVARTLEAPLDVIIARKVGAPDQPELGVGAVAEGGGYVLNADLLEALGLEAGDVKLQVRRELGEIVRRQSAYRGGSALPGVQGRIVILVDDGLATGATMRAAIQVCRHHGAERIIVAAPVGAKPTCELLGREADEVVCLRTPEPFHAIGGFYFDFAQLSDEEVTSLLRPAADDR